MPSVNAQALSLHLAEISRHDAHAVPVLDGASWHVAGGLVMPGNLTLLHLPPYAPELNPVENVWKCLRKNKLAITAFDGYDDIVDKCCKAWNFLANDKTAVASITADIPRIAVALRRSGASDFAGPTAMRVCRIDLRTA